MSVCLSSVTLVCAHCHAYTYTYTYTYMYYTTHANAYTAIHVVQASTQVLCMYVLTHIYMCICIQTRHTHHTFMLSVSYICTALPSMCTAFKKIITAPWDYAWYMAYVYTTMKLAALRITRVVTMAGVVTVVASWTCQSG